MIPLLKMVECIPAVVVFNNTFLLSEIDNMTVRC